jgi:predicted outer membrane repeat protein
MKRLMFLGLCLGWALAFSPAAFARILYVDAAAAGAETGESWTTAYGNLQEALDAATAGDEIWLAAGTYRPTVEHRWNGENPNPRYQSFLMVNGVGIYGGFSGTETSREERNPALHETILSGDIGVPGSNADNCYHVIYHPENRDIDATAILDGVTIADGYANGTELTDLRHRRGAGMFNIRSVPTVVNCLFRNNVATESGGALYNIHCSGMTVRDCRFENNAAPAATGGDHVGAGVYNIWTGATFSNCTFTGNVAYQAGGGMFSYQSTVTVASCTFSNNAAATAWGGGIFFDECATSTVVNCTIANNSAQISGGGMHNYMSSPTVIDCLFSGNSAQKLGGGLGNNSSSAPTLIRCRFVNNTAVTVGGAVVNTDSAHPHFIECAFWGNQATQGNGGGIWNSTTGASFPRFTRCVFSGNTASLFGGAIFNEASDPTLTECILWGDTALQGAEIFNNNASAPVVTFCYVQGGYPGAGNRATYPPPLLSVAPPGQSIGAVETTVAFAVTNLGFGTMSYSASEAFPWLAVVGGANGGNGGTLVVSCQANTGPARTGTVVVTAAGALGSPRYLQVVQAEPPIATTPASRIHSGMTSLGQTISVVANVPWTATADAAWIAITSGGSGTGNGTVIYEVISNGGTVRAGTITIAGGGVSRTFAVYQWPLITMPGVSAEGDVDGDGPADLSVYHPATGNWHVLFSAGVRWTLPWGWSATLPVPADYNGDGMLDFAVYHPATGNWHIQESGAAQSRIVQFGWSATVPVPGDYDGDGQADQAVFHPAGGRWYFICTAAGRYSVQWGWATTIPVPADYDGDGATDIAVYHPPSGLWQILKSSTGGAIQKKWGWSSALPVPADYDGDGQADIAVFHRATGKWYISYSGGGSWTKAFGWAATIPVAADYDGDGVADLAVYHPATGNWHILKSTTGGTLVKNWGWSSAKPTLLYPLIHSWFKLP